MAGTVLGLVCEAHGTYLRLLASHSGRHFQGLTHASRHLKDRLSSRSRRRLVALDQCFAVLRHITQE
eukprot:8702810-Prorocentrum_lima.AAC.1